MELKSGDESKSAILEWRRMIGPSKFLKGFGSDNVDTTTFRWNYALSDVRNTAHGADSVESAKRELAIFDALLKPVDSDQLEKWTV
jgi:nucleoside-diphosphate kinase